MPQRLKVLMSAYACEPGKGSEPEVGWQWALQMARFHDVTVLTRANNRPAIERGLEALRGRQPLPTFVYHDRGQLLLELKSRGHAVRLYYVLWQKSARDLVAWLHDQNRYDLLHHVTFASFRYPVAIWGHGVPCIWGPIGGIESIPHHLLPWRHPASLIYELFRNASNRLQVTRFHVLPKRARATTLILVSTREMQRTFAKLGFDAQVMPTIGLNTSELPFQPHRLTEGPLRLLFVGNVITLKGIDLALAALRQSQTNAVLTVIGTGNYLEASKRLTEQLGLRERVKFEGRLPREEVLRIYPRHDVFLFPSLHDTGGYAVIEAMFNELPVICLECGGPAVVVSASCGQRVPLGRRAKVIGDLAAAIRWYDQNRAAIPNHGRAARQAVLREYAWDTKGAAMNERYQQAVTLGAAERKRLRESRGFTGTDGLTKILSGVFSLRGLAFAAVGLVLVGALGFLSVSHLKRQAKSIVSDTLPGLSLAGQANASMAQGFNRVLLLLVANDAREQDRLRHEIESFSEATTSHLARYRQAIHEDQDRLLFDQLTQRRQEYLEIRNRTLALLDQQKQSEALALYQSELAPAYQRYKETGEHLFDYSMRQGNDRGETIMRVCTVTQWVVAGIGVFVFLVGFVIGFFK